MRTEKWKMYIDVLQGHPSLCKSFHTKEDMQFITNHIPPKDFPRMLDIGAGEGLETKVLKDLGYDVTGIVRGDLNTGFAKKNYPGVKFIDCDMHDLPFPSGSFDGIYTNQVFEHAFAPFIFLLEMYCVLREGGRIWIAMPEFKEKGDLTANKDINYISHHHPNIVCWNLLSQMFEKTGFKVLYKKTVESNPYFDNPYLLEKQPISFLHSDVQTVVNKRRELYG